MRIIAFIEDDKVIKKILDWLGIDELKRADLCQENCQLLFRKSVRNPEIIVSYAWMDPE